MVQTNDALREETSVEKKPARYVNEQDAARYIGMSASWIRTSRIRGSRIAGPPFYKMGGAVRYLVTDLDGWLEERRHEPDEAA